MFLNPSTTLNSLPVQDEWDAGYTPLLTSAKDCGRWTVKRENVRFMVVFHRFHNGQETLLAEFPLDESGRQAAKACARKARNTNQTLPNPRGA